MNWKKSSKRLSLIGAALVAMLVVSLACASAEPTVAPVAPAQPAQPAAPSAAPQPTAVLVTGAPTPIPAKATPTRVLPTATPIAMGGPKYGGTFRFAHRLHIDNLDPIFNTLAGAFQVFHAVNDTLFRLDVKSNLIPGLAESWEFSPDGKVITLNLREGVKFHDGTSFNAQTIKWHFERMLDPEQNSTRRAELEPFLDRVEVVDNNTVKLYMFNPYRPLLPQLASDRMGWIVSPAAVEKFGGGREGGYGRRTVGTGPFRFVEWIVDTHVLLERNEDYWEEGLPYLDAIRMQGVLESPIRLAMLRTGETDMIYNFEMRAQDVPTVEKNPELRVVAIEGGSTNILHFNAGKAPYDNEALRQAISYGMNRQQFVDVVLGGAAQPAWTMIAAGWAHNPDIKPISYDPEMAKQKLIEAGYPNGVTVPMGCPATGPYFDVCEFTQAMLSEVGINLSLEIVERGGYFRMDDQGYFRNQGMGASRWGHRVDPHQLNQALWHKGGFKVLGTYVNEEISALIEKAASVYDLAEARKLYDQIQTIAATEATVPALAWSTNFQAMRKDVMNYVPFPTVFEHLEFLWLDR